jgi:hypothetical protein
VCVCVLVSELSVKCPVGSWNTKKTKWWKTIKEAEDTSNDQLQ